MIIHFICRGNVYRSRLAESYLNAKKLGNIKAISSGIEADKNYSGIISWYAQRLTQKNHLISFEKPNWQQTTKELLQSADLTIFMDKSIYDFCVDNLGFDNTKKFEVWEIEDLIRVFEVNEAITKTECTYEEIKKKVEELVVHLPQLRETSE